MLYLVLSVLLVIVTLILIVISFKAKSGTRIGLSILGYYLTLFAAAVLFVKSLGSSIWSITALQTASSCFLNILPLTVAAAVGFYLIQKICHLKDKTSIASLIMFALFGLEVALMAGLCFIGCYSEISKRTAPSSSIQEAIVLETDDAQVAE